MNFLITAALPDELNPVRENLNMSSFPSSIRIDFLLTGVGISNAKWELEKQIQENQYDFILNVGTAGSLEDNLKVGDIFIPDEIEYFSKEKKHTINLEQKIKLKPDWQTGVLVSSDDDIIKPEDKKELKSQTGAKAVDMEAYAIAKICEKENIPFLCLKVISDLADSFVKREYLKALKKITPDLVESTILVISRIISEHKENYGI